MVPDYIYRMQREYENLKARIDTIDTYYAAHLADMSGIEAYMMKKQRKAMVEYANALLRRIGFYKEKEGIK